MADVSLTARRNAAGPRAGPNHIVQFYENEAFLSDAVSDFLAAGLTAGQPLIVIATEPHRNAYSTRLKSMGFDVAHVSRNGHLTLLDVEETLSTFMVGSMPDGLRFKASLGSVIETSPGEGYHASARVYGELVELLWKDGNADGAIRVEELWNELARTHSFTLLCAYAMGNFYKEAHGDRFHEVCRLHTEVRPTARYTLGDDEARLVEISLLQQRTRALETEIEHRKDLEHGLREALAARCRAEEALRQSQQDLKRAAVERERLLERERVARAEAEAANRAKNEFLTVMSHELRTPLNAIGGHVQLVEMGIHGPVSDAQRDALARVQRSQQHLLVLINDVLNLTRIEMGRIEYVMEEIPLEPLLADVTAKVEPLLSAKQLSYESMALAPRTGEMPIVVRADREKVQQILLNLLTNAIKFTPTGGRITVEAGPCQEAPAMACVHVRDTGIGIPSAKLESVFEPFVQLATRPVSQQQGIGLGLSISRDLARGMGGDITATCAAGEGATLTLTLARF